MTHGKTWALAVVLTALPRLAAAQVPPQVPVNDPYAPAPAAPVSGASPAPPAYSGPPPATPYYSPGAPPPPVYTQQVATPPAAPHHHGFTIGAAMGPGEFDYSTTYAQGSSHGGLALSLRAGLFLTRRLAIVGDIEGLTFTAKDNPNSAVLSDAVTIAAQYYVNPKVWIKGGVGIGNVSASEPTSACDGCSTRSDSGSAVILGLGYEVVQREHYALSFELSGGTGEVENNDTGAKATVSHAGLLIGLQWF